MNKKTDDNGDTVDDFPVPDDIARIIVSKRKLTLEHSQRTMHGYCFKY
jgi:hypothetical protein